MGELVDYTVQGSAAILGLNNPPVNALRILIRQNIQNGLHQALRDDKVKVIVIHGKGQVFCAGADISEFKRADTAALHEPTLVDLGEELEASTKPVVAAIHGFCLGGGLELALSCHYRVVDSKARFGFPEVNIGILPGARGTQLFPRLCGVKASLEIIPTGRHFTAKKATEIGLVDKVVNGNVVDEALKFAETVSGKSLQGRRASELPVKDADIGRELLEGAMAKMKQSARSMLSPVFCIKSIRAALDYPDIRDGLEKEQEYAALLMTSNQAAALQYAFFAERAAVKWQLSKDLNYRTVKPKKLKTGAVIGGGTMGSGITMAMLNAGFKVTLLEQNQKFLQRGLEAVKQLYMGSVQLGRMSQDKAQECMSRLKSTLKYPDLRDVDIVVEAVYENLGLKQKVFAELDKVCKPGALLCSNTSTLNIDKIASATSRPESVIGTHFFVPAYHMKLLENVRGKKTSAETIATATKFGTTLGKALFLLEEGALPQQVDQVIEDFGIPIGPLKVNDLSGLDIGRQITKERMKAAGLSQDDSTRYIQGQRISRLGDILVDNNRYGRKTGCGWYRYAKPGAKEAMEDPWVTDTIIEYSKKHGIERRQISPQEIHERCLYPLINEGFKVLEEGIAEKPEDIDTIWLMGYGWPRHTGGPMFYASQVGLKRIYDRICYYFQQHPTSKHWQPSVLLARLSQADVPMKQWTSHRIHSQL